MKQNSTTLWSKLNPISGILINPSLWVLVRLFSLPPFKNLKFQSDLESVDRKTVTVHIGYYYFYIELIYQYSHLLHIF